MSRWLWLLVFSAWASAWSTTAEFNTTLKTVDQLVTVDAGLDFPAMLPGAVYSQDVTVRMALPAESLRNLQSDVVRVHVVAYASEPSWLTFSSAGKEYRAYAFSLECRVASGACQEGSRLSAIFRVVARVPQNASTEHAERFFIQASLSQDYPSLEVQSGAAGVVQDAETFFKKLPWDQAAQSVQRLIVPAASSPAPLAYASSGPAGVESGMQAVRIGSGYVPADTSSAPQTRVWHSPSLLPDGRDNISPIAGLVVTKDDAVFTGGVVVMILLAILFYRRFFAAQRSNGLLDA